MTAADLSRSVGIAPSGLSRIENGGRSLEFSEAAAVVEVLGIDMAQLLVIAQTFERHGVAKKRAELEVDLNSIERLAIEAACGLSQVASDEQNGMQTG